MTGISLLLRCREHLPYRLASTGSRRHGVVVASAAGARDVGCSVDEFVIELLAMRGHLASTFMRCQAMLTRVPVRLIGAGCTRPLWTRE